MPRQNTRPVDFPPHILAQIEQLATRIVAARKRSGATQMQWAQQLGISQPTMARLERGDPSVATATYVMCLWLINPQLNLCSLLEAPAPAPAPTHAPVPALAPAALAAAPASEPEAGHPPTSANGANVAEDFAALLNSFAPRMPAL